MDNVSQAPLILITGGSRGVGAATARLAAARGYDVAISYVANEPAALAVVADVEALGRRALAMRADSVDPHQVADLFAAIDRSFGRIDVLVNKLGCCRLSHAWRTSASSGCSEMHISGGEPGRVDRVKDSIPMGRGGQPEEVARAILWLASAEASFVTGTFLDVTGGK
ncbi:SDR family oxidoreductase [Pseudomonas sp. TMB3-21]